MKPGPIIVVAASVALLTPTVGTAQLAPEQVTGSLIPVQPRKVIGAEARAVRKGFARCIYRKATPKALALLQNSDLQTIDLRAAKIANLGEDLRMPQCLDGELAADQQALGLKITVPFLRDLLAEEAYLAVTPGPPPLPIAPVGPVQVNYVTTGDKLPQTRALTDFTDCTVLSDVAHADALLRTVPGSREEREAARALAPALGACLTQGQQVSLTAVTIRAFMAYAMWNRFVRKAAP